MAAPRRTVTYVSQRHHQGAANINNKCGDNEKEIMASARYKHVGAGHPCNGSGGKHQRGSEIGGKEKA